MMKTEVLYYQSSNKTFFFYKRNAGFLTREPKYMYVLFNCSLRVEDARIKDRRLGRL